MKSRLATLFRSAVEWFEKGTRMQSEKPLSREELRAMVLEILSEEATLHHEAAQRARAFGVQGGNPLTVDPGNPGDIVKYISAPDTLGPATNFVETGGKVGIGTTSPSQPLDVKGVIKSGDGTVFLQRNLTDQAGRRNWGWGTEATTAGDVALLESTANTTDPSVIRLTIMSGGNVGIGTTSPSQPLDVKGAIKSGAGTVFLQRNLTDQAGRRNWGWGTEATTVGDLALLESTANTTDPSVPRLTVLSGGNVGIGVTSPLNKVHVEGGNVQIGSPDGNNSGWRTLLLGTSAKKQSSDPGAFGPEMITAAAKNNNDTQTNRRVVMWAGAEGDTEAMFLLNSTGFLEWGAGGNNDQDSSLGRTAAGQMALINDKGFIVGRSGAAGGAELLRVNADPNNTDFIVNINGAGSSATLDVKSHSTTKPTIRAQQGSATADIFGGFVTDDQNLRFEIDASGRLSWGPGNVVADVSLRRFPATGTAEPKGLQLDGGDLYVSLAGKGIILKNAAGTVCRRVRLNDAGNDLIFDTITCP